MAEDFWEIYQKCKAVTDELFEAAGEEEEKLQKAIKQKKEADKNLQKIIGSRIKSYRVGEGLTQEELAKKLGVTKMEIIRWEKGVNMPRQGIKDKLEALNIL